MFRLMLPPRVKRSADHGLTRSLRDKSMLGALETIPAVCMTLLKLETPRAEWSGTQGRGRIIPLRVTDLDVCRIEICDIHGNNHPKMN
jgi:hypothetical protein